MYQAGSKYQNSRINVKTECQGKGPKIDQIKARQGKVKHKNLSTKTWLRAHKTVRETVRLHVEVQVHML